MSWSEVKITAPDTGTVFQSGQTDRNGRFMFFPDGHGTWEVVIQDGMGHRLPLDVTVAEESGATETVAPAPAPATTGKNRTMGVVAGIGVIFGLCGFLYGWRARQTAS